MKITKKKSVTNGQRHIISISKNLLSKNSRDFNHLTNKQKKKTGRSSLNGRITVWNKSNGKKKNYKKIDFSNKTKTSIILSTTYDPFRTSFINLNFDFIKKKYFFTLCTHLNYTGHLLKTSLNLKELKLGYRTNIKFIPTGSIVHNVSTLKNNISQYIKSAGTFGQLIEKKRNYASIKLPSKKKLIVSTNGYASIGINTNILKNHIIVGKAGTNRNKGKRPHVRGVAMNPVDHPHGGRTNGGRSSVTPWGFPTK